MVDVQQSLQPFPPAGRRAQVAFELIVYIPKKRLQLFPDQWRVCSLQGERDSPSVCQHPAQIQQGCQQISYPFENVRVRPPNHKILE